jgi:flagellar basal body-associated protein FliL
MLLLKIVIIIAIILAVLFLLSLIIYFFNLDMKMAARMGPVMTRHYDRAKAKREKKNGTIR